ncbi:thermonuclease family protein [Pseudophaeobacter sp. 1A09344]
MGRDIVMRTYKDSTATGKYGRWLAEIYRAEGDAVSINQELVTNGLAVTASY